VRESVTATGTLLRDPVIRALLMLWWIPPLCFVAEGVGLPFADAAGAGPAGFGLFLAAMPTGTVASEALAGILVDPATRERIALPLVIVSLLPLAAFVAHPALPLAIGLMLVTGLCASYTLGIDKWFVDAVPEQIRGRAMSLLGAGIMTFQGLGMAVGGAAAESLSPCAVISGAGIVGTLGTLGAARSLRRSSPAAVNAHEAALDPGAPGNRGR
jgi:Major Facilitator Superfamily